MGCRRGRAVEDGQEEEVKGREQGDFKRRLTENDIASIRKTGRSF